MIDWLRKLGKIEKLFLALAVLYAATFFSKSAFAVFIAFLFFVVGIIVAVRLVFRAVRKTLWRLRNRLIVSYLFIAVVPLTLLLALVSLGAYMLTGQMAIYMAYSELERRLTLGPAVTPRELVAELTPQLGDVFLLDDSSQSTRDRSIQNFRRVHLPPAANYLDVEVLWFSPITLDGKSATLAIRTRPSAVLSAVFGQKMSWRDDLLLLVVVLVSLSVVAQLVSIVLGISITRSITGAVHDLYEGTLRINQGDFSHRIPVRGHDQLAELSDAFNRMTGSLERLIVVEKEKERLSSELEIAREVQSRLFPKAAPKCRTLRIAGLCHPANMVSGDYYDFVPLLDGNLAMAIGDVAGKGISAALLMAAIQSVTRTQLSENAQVSPARVVALLNRQLFENTSPEKYATFYFGVYDDTDGMLTYANAGHLPPIRLRGGNPTQLEVTGTVVGAFPQSGYTEGQMVLEPGDLLVAYTDGIVEPENAYGEMFGDQRLIDVLVKHDATDSDEIIAKTVEAVKLWTGSVEQQDDMTMVVARRIA